MAQSLSKILVHLVFSTKNRERILTDAVRCELHPYMNKILVEMDSSAIAIGSVEDHIHILFRLLKNHAVCKVIEEVKTSSSKWIKTKRGGVQELSLAKRLRRVFREPIKCRGSSKLYRRPKGASPHENVSGRVSHFSESV